MLLMEGDVVKTNPTNKEKMEGENREEPIEGLDGSLADTLPCPRAVVIQLERGTEDEKGEDNEGIKRDEVAGCLHPQHRPHSHSNAWQCMVSSFDIDYIQSFQFLHWIFLLPQDQSCKYPSRQFQDLNRQHRNSMRVGQQVKEN